MDKTPSYTEATGVLLSFLGIIERVYGLYIDGYIGMELHGCRIRDHVIASGGDISKRIFFSDGNPNRDEAKYNHSIVIEDLVTRNVRDGSNHILLSQSCLVFIYSIWDTDVRPRYATIIGCDQNEVVSDLFGDIRNYRNAIIHNNCLLKRETKLLNFIKVGEIVGFSRAQMDSIFSKLFQEVNRIGELYSGQSVINFGFERRLNAIGEFPPKGE